MSSTPSQSGATQQSSLLQFLPVIREVASPASDKRASSTRATSGRRVLIVDDNHDAAHSLGMLLRMTGYEVRVAHDGSEGVAAAETFQPHAAILDIGMPEMNGYEAAQAIRGQTWGRDIVLIAVTGWDNDEDRKLSLSAGFDHHMCKPVDFAALARVVASSRVT